MYRTNTRILPMPLLDPPLPPPPPFPVYQVRPCMSKEADILREVTVI